MEGVREIGRRDREELVRKVREWGRGGEGERERMRE